MCVWGGVWLLTFPSSLGEHVTEAERARESHHGESWAAPSPVPAHGEGQELGHSCAIPRNSVQLSALRRVGY